MHEITALQQALGERSRHTIVLIEVPLLTDGPFGGYTGYLGPQVSAPVCEVSCITRRLNAIYHD